MKRFNTTGVCIPSKHYMVDLSERVEEIKKMVDAGKYFTINRARQYGKTTTLNALRQYLSDEYEVVGLDFQGIGDDGFQTEQKFVKAFCRQLKKKPGIYQRLPEAVRQELEEYLARTENEAALDELSISFIKWCSLSEKPVVLIIDEVDSATNNQVFLDFLAQLRDGYISRDTDETAAFQSVILAGVTDVKYLKRKIRPDDQHKVNSPWNIAADFDIDMSLSEAGIKGMLDEYEDDHRTGMDTAFIAKQIRDYTSGYPYLVSRMCQIIDEKLPSEGFRTLNEAWTERGITEAVKTILTEDNTLFDSLMGKLTNYPELNTQLERLLLQGDTIEYLPDNEEQKQLRMYGFIVNNHNTVAIANKLFEMRLYKKYVSESRFAEELRPDALDHKPEFIKNGELNVPLIMERFIERHEQIWGHPEETEDAAQKTERFLEEEGRRRFLTYLSPIINGVGTYEIEPQTRTRKRMDIVIHYMEKRYIIELKIWRGERYNSKGEKQIIEYLDYWNLETGYMLSFNFNRKKEQGLKEVWIGNKLLYEGTV